MTDLKNTDPNEFNIEIENFGPISEGKISIKPLTIFIGANNSGKSYASMLIRSITKSPSFPMELGLSGRNKSWRFLSYFILEKMEEHDYYGLNDILRCFLDDFKKQKVKRIKIPKKPLENIVNDILEYLYGKILQKELVYSFASPLKDLIRDGNDSFKIKINGLSIEYKENNFKIIEYPKMDSIFNDDKKRRRISRIELIKETDEDVTFNFSIPSAYFDDFISEKNTIEKEDFIISFLIKPIIDFCVFRILDDLPHDSYYMPAARSGILQGHKVFTASMIKLSTRFGIEKIDIPTFSGVVADFIASILELPSERGQFYDLAEEFSKEIIKGDIIVEYSAKEYNYPEIKYKQGNMKIPLHRSSSTVSELAPLFLYLKYIVNRNSVLIIEEPEAHLHPKNQLILANFLVKLVRNGIKVIITTHSDYLIDKFNNFILISKLEQDKFLKKYNYGKNDFLKEDEVGVYLFDSDDEHGGNRITPIEINEDGISEESFTEVMNTLYDETDKIKRNLFD